MILKPKRNDVLLCLHYIPMTVMISRKYSKAKPLDLRYLKHLNNLNNSKYLEYLECLKLNTFWFCYRKIGALRTSLRENHSIERFKVDISQCITLPNTNLAPNLVLQDVPNSWPSN